MPWDGGEGSERGGHSGMYLPKPLCTALSSSSSRLPAPCHLSSGPLGGLPPGDVTGACDSLGYRLPELLALGQQRDARELWDLGHANASVPQFPLL